MRKCPGCETDMSLKPSGSDMVDFCPSCHGIWFDEGELKTTIESPGWELEETLKPAEAPVRAEGERFCPDCVGRLESYIFAYSSKVRIDRCVTCGGIFVDQGEVAAIREFMELSRKPDARAEQALALANIQIQADEKVRRAGELARKIETLRRINGTSWWTVFGVR